MLALLVALALQEEVKDLVQVEARVVITSADLRAWREKEPKLWSPWDGVGAPADVDQSETQALIRRLNAESVEDRDDAARVLERMGVAVLPMLKKSLDGASNEMKSRLETIARRIVPPPDSAPRVGTLSEKERGEFLKALAARKDARLVNAPTITGFVGQEMQIAVGEQLAYVRDMEMQVGSDASAPDPVAGVAWTGQRIVCKATLAEGRVKLECVVELSEMKKTPATLKKVETPIGAIEDPEIQTLRYRISPTLAAGEAALVGPLRRPWSSKEDARLWVVVTAKKSR